MKLEILKNRLKEVINLAEKICGKNASLPILSAVLIEAKDKQLTIKATNLDVGLEVEIPAKITSEGQVAVGAGVLGAFLNNLLKEEKVTLEAINDNLHLVTEKTSTLIKCLPTEDFPVIPRIKDKSSFSVQSGELIGGLRAVAYAASFSDIKPEIASVYLFQEEKELVFVATDSFRLAEKRISLKNNNTEFPSVIIPIKNVAEIIRVFDGVEEPVVIEAEKNQISFYTDYLHLTSRVIDGTFPNYRPLIPTSFKTELTVGKNELLEALKVSGVFSDKFNQITIKADPGANQFFIESKNQEVGESSVSLSATVEGEPIEVNFNGRYIMDSFSSFSSDTIVLGFTEKNRPLLVRGVGEPLVRYIVMPINR